MPDDILIRRAKPSDTDAVVKLREELLDFHQERDPYYTRREDAAKHTAEHMVKMIEAPESIMIVAEADGRVVGYLAASRQHRPQVFVGGEVISISDTCVSKDFRRGGVGVAMVEEIKKIADEMGIDRIEVGYSARNDNSVAFWGKMGFEPFSITAALDRCE